MFKEIITKLTVCSCVLILINSCNQKWDPPAELLGEWESDITEITVRTEYKPMEFEFITDTGVISFTVFPDKTVSGTIGTAVFESAEIKKNLGPAWVTGVGYTIKCGAVSQIFERDPLESKEVEIWLSPMRENQTIEAELRFTEGGAHFPMSGFDLKKVK